MNERELYLKLKPHIARDFRPTAVAQTTVITGGGATSFSGLTGTIANSQAPQFLLRDGSRSLTGNLAVDAGITIDGVDISAHAVDPNAHHAQQHSITGGDHTITGVALTLVGATALNTLGAITPSSAPGAASFVLKSSSAGDLTLPTFTATTSVTTPTITTATNVDLLIDPAGTGAVKFPNAQTIRTSTFDSSFPIQGFQINEVTSGLSALTIGKIQADELAVRVFVADEVRVDRGDEYWTKSYGIVSTTFTSPSSVGSTVSVTLEDSPAISGAIFTSGDYILFRNLEISTGLNLYNIWGQVTGYVNNANGTQTWTFTLRSGATSKEVRKGSLAIDFGASGAALIHLSVIDAAGAPYIKMRKWSGANPYTPSNFTTYLQLGNLSSTGNPNVTPAGFGLYARSTSDANRFILADDNGLQIRNASLAVWNGSNNDILIDQDGVRVRAVALNPLDDINAYRFETAAGTTTGGLYGRHFGGNFDIFVQAQGDNANDAWMTVRATGTAANGDANVILRASNSDTPSKEAAIWLDVDGSSSLIRMIDAQYVRFEVPTQSFNDAEPYLDLGANLGSAGKRWGVLYANQVIAGTISGASMSGATWQYPGSMVIDANSGSDTTVNVTNSGAGAVIFDVLGTLRQNGTAVSLSGHTHDDRYYTETEADARYVQTATLGNYLLASGATIGATSQAQEFANGIIAVAPNATTPQVTLRSARVAIASGNIIGGLNFQSNDTSLTAPGTVVASINAVTTSAHTAAQLGTELVFSATSGTTISEGLRVTQAGLKASRLGLGTASPLSARIINVADTLTGDGLNYILYTDVTVDGAITAGRTSFGAQLLVRNNRDSTDVGALDNNFYGANVNVYNNAAGVANNVYGNNAQVINEGNGSIVTAFGGLNQVQNQNTGTIGTVYGLSAEVENQSTGTITTMYGNRAYVYNTNGPLTTGYGVYAWMRQNGASGMVTNTYAFYARQDRDAGTSTNAYLYYGVFEGTHTLKRGLWLSGETENALSGKLAIGSLTSPTYTLDVTGNGRVTLDLVVGGTASITGAVTLVSSLTGTAWNITSGGAASMATVAASTKVTTPLIDTASGNLTLAPGGGTTNVTGALVGSSTASFATSVSSPLYTAASGNVTVSAPSSLLLNAATAATVDLQINSVAQWSASDQRLTPRGSVLLDVGDYNRKVRTLFAAELYVETLVAQNVLATIGGRVMVAPTTKLIADLSTSAPLPLWTNMTSWWSLDEASGNRSDSKGSNTLTDTNTVMSVGGKKNAAGMFVKANSERLTIADNASLSVGDLDFYIAAWVYPTLDDGASQHTIAAKAAGSGNRAWYLYVDWAANQAKFRVFDSTDASTTVTASTFGNLSVNTWYFVEAWHDSVNNQITIAVNGTSTTASHTTGSRDDTGPFQIGAANGSSLFDGYIDEALFAKYIPTSAERAWLYNGGTGRAYSEVSGVHTIDVEHNQWTAGDYIYMQTAPGGIAQIEAMQVVNGPFTITGGYRYWVYRNLDGTGINSWVTGDAVVNLGGAAGEGYLELTATSTIHNHLGPTTTYYVRTNTVNWNDVKPVVTQGNLRSFVDYTGDEFGTAAGNDLTLTPTTGFQGYAIDRTNGLRLFNVNFVLYESATKKAEIIPTEGLNLLMDSAGLTNRRQQINWFRDLSSKSATPAVVIATEISGTKNTAHFIVNRDASNQGAYFKAGVPTGYLDITETNDTTSSGSLYAGSWTVTGNVGLGIAPSALKLEINGHARIATGSSLYLGGLSDASESGWRLTYNSGAFFDVTDGDVVFRADNTTGGTERMRINYITGAVTFANSVGTDWTNLSYASGWGDYGGSFTPGQYKKVGDLVFLRGLVARTSGASTTIATLPVGFRPQFQYLFGVHTSAAGGGDRVDVTTAGAIVLVIGGATYVQLDGLVFSTLN